ncbi:TIGR02234 family membrane protein [uncultured Jatrophihabitans sp.]|uniref:TIGR02234 family membrane protein n=1 Tax=uncultured Jatrophihabitans sp. TaxID=1610747 RepID=UPI0035C9A964
MSASRRAYAGALILDAIGAVGALLIALRAWQTVTTPRPAPLHDDTLHLSGRTIDSAPTAFALVALAGVVAVIATRGTPRRVVGVVLAVSGAAIVWRSIAAASAVGTSRARALVTEHHSSVVVTAARPHVAVTQAWPALSVIAGVLVLVAGVLVAWQGHRWSAMSTRYEAVSTQADESDDARERTRQRAAATLWTALDRGEDPTDPRKPR